MIASIIRIFPKGETVTKKAKVKNGDDPHPNLDDGIAQLKEGKVTDEWVCRELLQLDKEAKGLTIIRALYRELQVLSRLTTEEARLVEGVALVTAAHTLLLAEKK